MDTEGRGWGRVARRGARRVRDSESPAGFDEPDRSPPPPWEPERWERVLDSGESGSRPDRGRGRTRRRASSSVRAIEEEIREAVGPRAAPAAASRFAEAAEAFDAGRWTDTWKAIRPLADEAPASPSVRELAGLSLYRLGRWKAAAGHLEAYRGVSGSTERNPVLADCYRALRRYRKVQELWDELRRASPSAELVVEGRIVAAGALADQERLADAIELMEGGPLRPRGSPASHHLRLWYALADLYERSGDTARARDLFARVTASDPDLADAAERLAAL